MIDLRGFGHQLWDGTLMTLELAVVSLVVGLLLGLLGASAKLSNIGLARAAANAYTTILRGIPELLTVLIIYFGATSVLMVVGSWFGYDEYIEISPFIAGVAALSLAFGAYATEVFRGAMIAIPKGQAEAGRVLGMSRIRVFTRITLPQVWRLALPGLGNLFLVLLKDTALVSVIGLEDIMRKANVAVGFTKEPFLFYMAAAFIYLTLTIISMVGISILEKRNSRGLVRG
ncbi:ABC transporter permease [Motiliproteus sp. MSK22-1]|nr:ABC transporter permease [Motiliproteus sp. MSK22-1]